MLRWHFAGGDPVASQCDIREGPAGDHRHHVYGLVTCQVTPAVVQLPTIIEGRFIPNPAK